jgi:tRNA threonylcarbamoyladenosine biosynthesis protein TsaE
VRRAVTVADEAGTRALAGVLAGLARRRDVIALKGALGAGKTAFARGFIAARGLGGEVPSPTFTLVQLYEAPDLVIYHFDLYRLERAEDGFELGIEEAFADGISLIEWPDRLGRYLPRERLAVTLEPGAGETERHIALEGFGSWAQRLDGVALHV